MIDKSYFDKADEFIQRHGPKPASLIPILQDIQAEYRYLPEELLFHVEQQLLRQVAVLRLDVLEDGDQRGGLWAVALDELIRLVEIGLVDHVVLSL